MESVAMDESPGESVRVPDSVLRRDQERLDELERRKQAKESKSVSEEKSDYFSATFNVEKSAIEELLCKCEQTDHHKAVQMLDEAAVKSQQLQKFLNDSMIFLTQYQLRQAQANLQTLQSTLTQRRSQVMPKKKFTFRSRTTGAQPQSSTIPPSNKEKTTSVVDGSRTAVQCGFSNLHDQTLIKRSEHLQQRDVLLSHLTNCKVRLFGSPNTLHIKNVQNCQILSGPVSSSVYVDGCADSTLVLACQQLRTHNTTDTQVYLHVTSRAIIEDCTRVGFAPFNWVYDELDADFKASGLDPSRNNWTQVDDFNWLAAGTPSPNWTLIPESERTTVWEV